jgi:hypothetical protein
MSEEEVFDPETADFAELQRRILAGEGVEKEEAEPEKSEKEPEQELEAQEPEEQEHTVYRREIDLGDGSGKQVFEADSIEALVDQLAKAQEHATRKIRELSSAKKAEPAQKAEEFTPEQKWVQSQEMLADPFATIDKALERKLGKDFQKKLDKLEAFEKAQREDMNAKQWMASKSDYYACPENGNKIEKYVQKFFDGDGSVENIEKAYQDLSASGLLKLKPGPKEGKTQEEGAETRIAQTAQPTRRVSSGLSTKRSVTRAPEPTEDELWSMPLEKLRDLAINSEK